MSLKEICCSAIMLILLFSPFGTLAAQDNSGEVQIYVFSDTGEPLKGVFVVVGGETYTSDESGLLQFTARPGTHDFTLTYGESVVAELNLAVRQGQATEVIITASRQDAAIAVEEGDEQPDDTTERKKLDESLPKGTLSGIITHIETDDPVANATVIFRGVDFETTTDEDGEFEVALPAGTYSISIIHPDFSTQTQDEIEIIAESKTEITMELTPSSIKLEAVPVFAATEVRVQGGVADLIEETRNSGVVVNLIGSEQISRMGDSDAASALRRVTGLTVVDGKYIYVRGMGERYSSSYLNNAFLPSPEVDKRVVPLDLFPVSVIESMAIQKAYSPNLIGDFGGGSVILRTQGIPNDRYRRRLRTTIKFSVGFDLGDFIPNGEGGYDYIGGTFSRMPMEELHASDFLGIDFGYRDLPEEIAEAEPPLVEGSLFGGYSASEIETFGESFENTWKPSEQLILPDFDITFSMRDKIEITDTANFGYSFSILYKNDFDTMNGMTTRSLVTNADGFGISNDLTNSSATQEVDISVLADIAISLNERTGFQSTTLLTRLTDRDTEQYEGFFSDNSANIKVTNVSWIERMLFSEKISGTIGLPIMNKADIDWQYAFSLAGRDSPDKRTNRFDDENTDDDIDEFYLSNRAEGAKRVFSDVQDLIHDGSVQINIPVFLFSPTAADYIEVGAHVTYRTRETDTRKFWFSFDETGVPADDPLRDIDNWAEALTPDNIHADGFRLKETTINPDNYTASQLLAAGYLNTDFLIGSLLRMNAGLRVEYSRQVVDTFDLYSGNPLQAIIAGWNVVDSDTGEIKATIPVEFLPALNLTLPAGDNMQFRFGASRTVNRPDFREMANTKQELHEGQGVFLGNPLLDRASIYSADLRWEAYLTETESVALGGFFKYFRHPIEIVYLGGAGNLSMPGNTEMAINVGAELEWQLNFRFISDAIRNGMSRVRYDSFEREKRARRRLGGLASFFRDLRTTGNASYIFSRVFYDEEQAIIMTSPKRPLQGQSPFVINVSLGYENSVSWSQERVSKTSVYLNYNVFGRRIDKVGSSGNPDHYEEPFHQLDLIFKQRFSEYVSMSIKAKNLLNLPATVTIEDKNGERHITKEYKKGRSFSLGLTLDL